MQNLIKIIHKNAPNCTIFFFLIGGTYKPPNPLAGLGSSTVLFTWYLYLSTYLSVLDVLEYLVYENVKVLVLVLVLVLDQKVLGTYK